ncbi:hypothetical protein [Chitinophaga eiseniae]|uniref:Signal transduction histidine kinase n=1 Tax=Chitinophaga eiseniae TaxID=634771 RepID=A0A847SD28_9BACT|nr:hypothetical protein [Chitinophaga eiseniae]NLR78074.1 hypothetical protein [Chitinophaga eiseniae]
MQNSFYKHLSTLQEADLVSQTETIIEYIIFFKNLERELTNRDPRQIDGTLISSQLGLLQTYLKSIKKVLINDRKESSISFWKRIPIAREIFSLVNKNRGLRKNRILNDVNRLLEIEELKRELNLERERSKSNAIFTDVLLEDITGKVFDLSLILHQCSLLEDKTHFKSILSPAKGISYYVNALISNFQDQKTAQTLKHHRYPVHNIDPDQFINTIINQAQSFATLHNISLLSETGGQNSIILINEAKFGRIVNNLIITALLSANEASQVKIYSKVENDVWQLELTVNDIGRPVDIINDEIADFKTMQESISAAFRSKNIFVANAIHLCKVLNIELETTSDIGRGTTYKITIPLAPIEFKPVVAELFKPERPVKILLLENGKIYTKYVTETIDSIIPQAEVKVFDYSDPAVLQALMEKPDIVFLPFGADFKNTIPILKRFKSIQVFKNCRVVCYGSSTLEETTISLKQAGVDFLLFLPHTQLEVTDILFHSLQN